MMPKIVDTVSLANTEMSIPDENILPEYTSSINIVLPNELKPLVIEGFEVFCLDDETETQVHVIDIEDGENESSEIMEVDKPQLSVSSAALQQKPLQNNSIVPVIVNLDDDDDDDDIVVLCDASTPKSQVAQLNQNSTQVTTPMSTQANEITHSSAINNNSILSFDVRKKPKKEKLDSIIKVEEFEICPEEQALKKEHLDLSKFSIKDRIRQSYIKIVRITCPVCKMMLEDSHVSDEILKHLKIHVGYFPYGCTLCDFVSADTIEVQQHSEKNHRRKLVRMIPESDAQKQEYETILRQVRKGDGVKEYFACKKCSCEFRKLDAYQRHIKVHSKILCPYCNFSCNKKRELTKHFDQFHQHLSTVKVLDLPKSQNNSDNSEDEKSGENLPSNKSNALQDVQPQLQLPLKFHSIKKESKPSEPPPLVCPSCKKQFVVVKTALRHLRYHASYYPYKCAYCRYIAMERPMVVDHLHRRHHEELTKIILHKNMEKEKKVYTELVSKMTKVAAQIYDVESYLSGNDSDNFDDEDNDQSKSAIKRTIDTADLTEDSQKQINGFPKKRRKNINSAANSLSNTGSYKLVSNPGQSLKIIFKKETHNSKGKNTEMSGDPNLKHPFLLACKVCGYATYVADLYREHVKIHKNSENSNLERDDPYLLHCDDCDYATYVGDLHNEHVEGHNVSKTLNLAVGSASLKVKAFSILKNIEAQSATLSALFRNCASEVKKIDAKSDSSINVDTPKTAHEIELNDINDYENFDWSQPSTSDNQQGDNIKICVECKKLASPSHFYFHTQTKLSLLPFKCLYCKFRYSTQKVVSSHIVSKHKDHPICVTYEPSNTHYKYNQSGTLLTCFCVYCNFSNDNRDAIREHIKENHKNKPVRVKVCKTVPLQMSRSTKDIINSNDKDIRKTESRNGVSQNSQSSLGSDVIFQDHEVNISNGFDSETPSESDSKKIEPLRIRKISPEFAFVKNTNGFLNDSIAFTDNPTVKCQLCKQLVQSKLVKQHLRKHFGIMRFQCKYCLFSGLFRFSVHQHILIKHPGFRINIVDKNSPELEFKEKLMKEFIEESMLCINSSAENIDEILLFQCPACPFNSSSKHVWFAHKKLHFNAVTMYCCAYCDLYFSETSKARSHCRTIHIPKLLKIIELTEIKAVLGNNPKYCRFRTLFAKGIPRTISNWNPYVKIIKIKSPVCKGKS